MPVATRVDRPGHQHGIRPQALELLLQPAVVILQFLASPHQVLAILDLVEIDGHRQRPASLALVSGEARRTVTDRRMVVAVEGVTIDPVVLHQFGQSSIKKSPQGPRLQATRVPRLFSSVAIFRCASVMSDAIRQSGWACIAATDGNGGKPSTSFIPCRCVASAKLFKLSCSRGVSLPPSALQRIVGPHRVAMHHLHPDLRHRLDRVRSQERHPRHLSDPGGNLDRLDRRRRAGRYHSFCGRGDLRRAEPAGVDYNARRRGEEFTSRIANHASSFGQKIDISLSPFTTEKKAGDRSPPSKMRQAASKAQYGSTRCVPMLTCAVPLLLRQADHSLRRSADVTGGKRFGSCAREEPRELTAR